MGSYDESGGEDATIFLEPSTDALATPDSRSERWQAALEERCENTTNGSGVVVRSVSRTNEELSNVGNPRSSQNSNNLSGVCSVDGMKSRNQFWG